MEVCPAFIDETGLLTGPIKNQPIYGVGMLIVPETSEITDSFYRLHFNFQQGRATQRGELRREQQARDTPPTLREVDRLMWSTRHHEYKFTEITRFNIQNYIDILNLYFSFANLEFHSLILDRRESTDGLDRWGGDEWAAYTHFARELLETRLNRDVFAIVDLQGKPDKSSVNLEEVLCSVGPVRGCLRATSDMSIFLQIVDVLLGCVQFDVKSQMGFYSPDSKRAQEKRQLVSFLKRRLGIPGGRGFMADPDASDKWSDPSAFTVSKGDWSGG